MQDWSAGSFKKFNLDAKYDGNTYFYNVTFTVDPEMVDTIKKNYFKAHKNQYKFKGFRKGKLTRKQVEKMMGGSKAVYSMAFGAYATEKILEYSPHKVIFITNQESDSNDDGSWIMTCDVFTEHHVDDFNKLLSMNFQLPRLEPQEYVDYRIETFRRLNPYLHRKENLDDVVEDGDMVEVSIQSKIDGKIFDMGCESSTNIRVIEGAVKPESLYENLLGAETGDSFSVETSNVSELAERFGAKISGSKFTLEVKINHIYWCEEANIDDDLAISAGFNSLNEWLSNLNDTAIRINEGRDHQLKRQHVIEHLERNSEHPEFPVEWGIEKAASINPDDNRVSMELVDKIRNVSRQLTLLRLAGIHLGIEWDDADKGTYQRDDNAYAEKVLQYLVDNKAEYTYVNADDYKMGGGDSKNRESTEGSAAPVGA